jgi:hypothetical protein
MNDIDELHESSEQGLSGANAETKQHGHVIANLE